MKNSSFYLFFYNMPINKKLYFLIYQKKVYLGNKIRINLKFDYLNKNLQFKIITKYIFYIHKKCNN